jgi:phage terminase small subunit
MAKKKEISEKHKLFCMNLIKKKFNQTKAYIATYPNIDPENARVNASQLLTKANVKDYLEELKKEYNLNDYIEVQDVIDGILDDIEGARQNKQYSAAMKGRELLGKYKAMFTDKIETNGTVRNIMTFGDAIKKRGNK